MYQGKVRLKTNADFYRTVVEACVACIVCSWLYMTGSALIDKCTPRAYDCSLQWCAEFGTAVLGVFLIGASVLGVLVVLVVLACAIVQHCTR